MDTGGLNNPKLGSDLKESNDVHQPGTSIYERSVITFSTKDSKPSRNVSSTPKGVENAKKRLRAFSIQKKSSLSPVSISKPISSGGATVIIGKASGVKTQPKPELDPVAEQKKPPKPPKPGARQLQESYIRTQKKTLGEIEDMKRKMELVELGIPLGLICPAPNSDKAMPTKAMPPIKTFLDSDKVDELIREAKKAKAEGKEFKFDYRKLLPDYDNPFQRKKEDHSEVTKSDENDPRKIKDKIMRRINKYDPRRHSFQKNFEQDRHREDKSKERVERKDIKHSRDIDDKSREKNVKFKERDSRSKDRRDFKTKERDNKPKERDIKTDEFKKDLQILEKEADVDLKDFVVCDSWSDNEDKSKDSTPKSEETKKQFKEKTTPVTAKIDPMEQLRESLGKKDKPSSPKPKLKRLNPVMDSFKFEIEDPDEDDVLDIYEENSNVDKFSKIKLITDEIYDSPLDMKLFEYDTKDETMDGMADDTFLESVINEIKQEEMDETSQDKALVEYDESPSKDDEIRDSVTPEMDDRIRELHSSRSDYSDGYKSTESECKSVESGYKSTDSMRLSEGLKSDCDVIEKVVEERKMAKYTVDSLETWSFVLKICQPLLFRHDKNKCYKETRMTPKVWFTENPKLCNCVKDRRVVYDELEMCKTELVNSLYSAKQIPEAANPTARGWYPRVNQCLAESNTVQLSNEWEAEDSQPQQVSATPEPSGDISLDKEYQRFMEAVWPEVADSKSGTPRSTPVRREASKKKADDELEVKQKPKKMKVSSEGWSQESDLEEQVDKSYSALQDFLIEALNYNSNPDITSKKVKVEKQKRKRKHSTSASVTDSSESEAKKRKKMMKKKENKKLKSKDAKRRRVIKKSIKKLKDKQMKKKKIIKIDEDLNEQEFEEKKNKDKKGKKKKQLKQKKKNLKKKKARTKSVSSSSSSSSSSESSSETESEPQKISKKKKNSEKKKKRKRSSSESTQEALFDVNILNNIKTERVTDDEKSKLLEFSPRRQKPREIINVKELQNDFVGNSIQIKQEVEMEEQTPVEEEEKKELFVEKQEEESQESQHENLESKELPPEFKEQQFQEQEESQSTPQLRPDESNLSQCSSQESIYSLKDQPLYEKDESHLRPSSQNSNYSFRDVMTSGMYSKNIEHGMGEHDMRRDGREMQRDGRGIQRDGHDMQRDGHDMRRDGHDMQKDIHDMRRDGHDMQKDIHDMRRDGHDMQKDIHDMRRDGHDMRRDGHDMQRDGHDMQKDIHDMQRDGHDMLKDIHDMRRDGHDMHRDGHDMQRDVEHGVDLDSQGYEQGNYEMYEQMAMAYQSDVASQQTSPPSASGEQRIETVVRVRTCGEIKCDWRAGDSVTAAPPPQSRPSRWGLKPGEVNIVLTGGTDQSPIRNVAEPVYKIQSIANRTDNSAIGYDEAYMDMYGASDKLQYGDCFSTEVVETRRAGPTLDDRITLALRTTVLGEVAKSVDEADEKDSREKGILVTKSLSVSETRGTKRVSFADGYKPGQDSDVEDPPVKKKKKPRRVGCAWPCPATHPDHVPLWDALPPPPPPPGSPPPPAPAPPPPAHLLRAHRPRQGGLLPPPHGTQHKFDPNSMPAFMPPEPPPGLISFQNL